MKGWQMQELKNIVKKYGGQIALCESKETAQEKARELGTNAKILQVAGDPKHYVLLPEGADIKSIAKEIYEKAALEVSES
ncbi:hypothetical protein QBE54_11260 [Thermatribacter velox]|uniref:Uncharacterized protein n=1 Tax=Thermatribacter velox TaxID=3039681 RepID=A0ABZ2YAV0_9BACT